MGGNFLIAREEGQSGFHVQGAIEAPLAIANGLHVDFFDRALGREILKEFVAVRSVGFGIFFGQNYGLAGEAVFDCVEGGLALAFG